MQSADAVTVRVLKACACYDATADRHRRVSCGLSRGARIGVEGLRTKPMPAGHGHGSRSPWCSATPARGVSLQGGPWGLLSVLQCALDQLCVDLST